MQKHKLSKLKISELSLVGAGMNNKTFIIKKNKGGDMEPAIESILNAKFDVKALDAVMKSLPQEDKAKVLGATKLLKSIGKLPEGVMKAVLDASDKSVGVTTAELQVAVDAAIAKKALDEKAAADTIKKAQEGKLNTKELPPNIAKAFTTMAGDLAEIKKQQLEATEQAKTDRAEIVKMKAEKEHKVVVAKAAEFKGLNLDQGDLVSMLEAVPADKQEAVMKTLRSISEVSKEVGIFKEVGSSQEGARLGGTSNEAHNKLTAIAKEKVSKSAAKLTDAQAYAQAYDENPELAAKARQ